MKHHRNLFSSVVILHSLLTKQQKCIVPSTREVTIDYVPSLGRVVVTWQQTDELGRYAHKFTLLWPSYFNFFCPANTLKTLCMLHWTAERETTGLKLWVERKIVWVNAIYLYKFDSFPKSVLSSNCPKLPTLSLIITPYGKYIKTRSNLV